MGKTISLAVGFLLISTIIPAQELPDVKIVIGSSIQKLNEQDVSENSNFTYIKRHVVEDLNDRGETKEKHQKIFRGRIKNGSSFEESITPDTKEFRSMGLDSINLKNILSAGRYNYILEGINIINGKTVYTVGFEPRHPSKQPEDSGDSRQRITNKVLNNLSGLIRVDKNNYTIWRVAAHLNTAPIAIFTVARLHQLDVMIEQQEYGGFSVGKRIVAVYRYDKFFYWLPTFKRETLIYDGFTPVDPAK